MSATQKGERMSFYRTCPHCGAHLDPGERCDCHDNEKTVQGAAIWSVKNELNTKPVNDSERYRSNIAKESVYSRLDFLTGMEEDIVDDSAFQPSP